MAIVVFTIGELFIVSIQDAYIARISNDDTRSQYFAAASIRFSVSRVFAPQFIIVAGVVGYLLAFLMVGMLALGSSFIFYWMFSKSESGDAMESQHIEKETS